MAAAARNLQRVVLRDSARWYPPPAPAMAAVEGAASAAAAAQLRAFNAATTAALASPVVPTFHAPPPPPPPPPPARLGVGAILGYVLLGLVVVGLVAALVYVALGSGARAAVAAARGRRACPRDASGTVCGGPGRGHCPANSATCACAGGWSGAACDAPVRHCPSALQPDGSTRVCNGHGACSGSASCVCDPGWAGDACTVQLTACPSVGGAVCGGPGRGTCGEDGACTCAPGWGGPGCAVNLTACPGASRPGGACSGRGTCVPGDADSAQPATCACESGRFGEACSETVQGACPVGPNGAVCSGRGACVTGVCACPAGYGDIDCSAEAPAVTAPAPLDGSGGLGPGAPTQRLLCAYFKEDGSGAAFTEPDPADPEVLPPVFDPATGAMQCVCSARRAAAADCGGCNTDSAYVPAPPVAPYRNVADGRPDAYSGSCSLCPAAREWEVPAEALPAGASPAGHLCCNGNGSPTKTGACTLLDLRSQPPLAGGGLDASALADGLTSCGSNGSGLQPASPPSDGSANDAVPSAPPLAGLSPAAAPGDTVAVNRTGVLTAVWRAAGGVTGGASASALAALTKNPSRWKALGLGAVLAGPRTTCPGYIPPGAGWFSGTSCFGKGNCNLDGPCGRCSCLQSAGGGLGAAQASRTLATTGPGGGLTTAAAALAATLAHPGHTPHPAGHHRALAVSSALHAGLHGEAGGGTAGGHPLARHHTVSAAQASALLAAPLGASGTGGSDLTCRFCAPGSLPWFGSATYRYPANPDKPDGPQVGDGAPWDVGPCTRCFKPDCSCPDPSIPCRNGSSCNLTVPLDPSGLFSGGSACADRSAAGCGSCACTSALWYSPAGADSAPNELCGGLQASCCVMASLSTRPTDPGAYRSAVAALVDAATAGDDAAYEAAFSLAKAKAGNPHAAQLGVCGTSVYLTGQAGSPDRCGAYFVGADGRAVQMDVTCADVGGGAGASKAALRTSAANSFMRYYCGAFKGSTCPDPAAPLAKQRAARRPHLRSAATLNWASLTLQDLQPGALTPGNTGHVFPSPNGLAGEVQGTFSCTPPQAASPGGAAAPLLPPFAATVGGTNAPSGTVPGAPWNSLGANATPWRAVGATCTTATGVPCPTDTGCMRSAVLADVLEAFSSATVCGGTGKAPAPVPSTCMNPKDLSSGGAREVASILGCRSKNVSGKACDGPSNCPVWLYNPDNPDFSALPAPCFPPMVQDPTSRLCTFTASDGTARSVILFETEASVATAGATTLRTQMLVVHPNKITEDVWAELDLLDGSWIGLDSNNASLPPPPLPGPSPPLPTPMS